MKNKLRQRPTIVNCSIITSLQGTVGLICCFKQTLRVVECEDIHCKMEGVRLDDVGKHNVEK